MNAWHWLTRISGLGWWIGMVEWNTGITFDPKTVLPRHCHRYAINQLSEHEQAYIHCLQLCKFSNSCVSCAIVYDYPIPSIPVEQHPTLVLFFVWCFALSDVNMCCFSAALSFCSHCQHQQSRQAMGLDTRPYSHKRAQVTALKACSCLPYKA